MIPLHIVYVMVELVTKCFLYSLRSASLKNTKCQSTIRLMKKNNSNKRRKKTNYFLFIFTHSILFLYQQTAVQISLIFHNKLPFWTFLFFFFGENQNSKHSVKADEATGKTISRKETKSKVNLIVLFWF